MNNYMNQHMDPEQDTKKHTVNWFNNLRVDVQTEFILELIRLRNKKKDITQANRWADIWINEQVEQEQDSEDLPF